jgi:type I restriction enzyme R subunit
MQQNIRSNFDMLRPYEAELWRLGALAERYFAEDPNTSLLKLRQLAELLAQSLAARSGLYGSPEESQYELIRRLQIEGVLPREIRQVFDQIRVTGNAANHALEGDHAKALATLKLSWQLCLWFHRTFKQADYRSGPFLPPAPPRDESADLLNELAALRQAVAAHQAKHEQTESALQAAQTQLSALGEERAVWEQIATESDQAKAKLAEQLAGLQAQAQSAPQGSFNKVVASANLAASLVQLDEAETRRIIDQQLRQAHWEADSVNLRYSKGARPVKGRNLAIAEWPCEGYSADYVLFHGLVPLAVVEAKRGIKDVSADLQQSKRYSRTFSPSCETELHARNWGKAAEFRIPFVFATNGRPYRLLSVAALAVHVACEGAVKERAARDGLPSGKARNLHRLLNEARSREWVTDAGFSASASRETRWNEQRELLQELGCDDIGPWQEPEDPQSHTREIVDAIRTLRNGMAHGETFLAPNLAPMFQAAADFINQLFAAPSQ